MSDTTTEKAARYRLVDASDPEWVADLLDCLRDGDLDRTLAAFDVIVEALRRASKARRILATVDPELLCLGLARSAQRRTAAS